MFLAELNAEQKAAFMTLAHAIITADGVRDKKEADMMRQYRLEMNLPDSYLSDVGSLEQAIAVFEKEDTALRQEMAFELVALAHVDSDYAIEERQQIVAVLGKWGLNGDFTTQCLALVEQVMELYSKIGSLVHGK